MAKRVYRAFGKQAVGIIREDPYRLARDIRGIGFRTADQVGRSLGIAPDAPQRLRAGVAFALSQCVDDGHCGYPETEAIELAARMLEVGENLVAQAATEEVAARRLVRDMISGAPHLFLPELHQAEKLIATRLKALKSGLPPWTIKDMDKARGPRRA